MIKLNPIIKPEGETLEKRILSNKIHRESGRSTYLASIKHVSILLPAGSVAALSVSRHHNRFCSAYPVLGAAAAPQTY